MLVVHEPQDLRLRGGDLSLIQEHCFPAFEGPSAASQASIPSCPTETELDYPARFQTDRRGVTQTLAY